MLAPIHAAGGTMHGSAVAALHRDGLRVQAGTKLVVIVVGDEAGESGESFAQTFRNHGYIVDAMALLVAGSPRGTSVRDASRVLNVPYSEVTVEQFDDPYHVTRVLRALLEAPVAARAMAVPVAGLVEKVMATKLVEPPA